MLGASAQTNYRRLSMFSNDPGAVAVQLIFSFIDAMALTGLVFFRTRFGERFYTPFKFCLAILVFKILMALRLLAIGMAGLVPLFFGLPPMVGSIARGMAAGAPPQPALFDATYVFYVAFWLVGGAQLVAVLLRAWHIGEHAPVHSKSTGQSLLSFGGRINHFIATIFLEPAAVLTAGYLLTLCDPNLPTSFFVVLALFLAISATHQYRLCRSDMLDEEDARILAGFYAEQAEHVAKGRKPVFKLGRLFIPFLLPRKPQLQIATLRAWAEKHRQAASNDAAAAPEAAPSSSPPAPPAAPA